MTELDVLAALQSVIDPEVGIDIVNLGLVLDVNVAPTRIDVQLIMTSVACPMHADLARQAEEAVVALAGTGVVVDVRVVDTPDWSPDRMSPQARRRLGW